MLIRAAPIRLGMLPVYTGQQGTRQIRWGLLHLEPPKSQAALIEASQIGLPTCFLIKVSYIDKIRYVACVHGMSVNQADRCGLSL